MGVLEELPQVGGREEEDPQDQQREGHDDYAGNRHEARALYARKGLSQVVQGWSPPSETILPSSILITLLPKPFGVPVVVGGNQGRGAGPVYVRQEVEDLARRVGVEIARRLIRQENRRPQGYRPGYRHPLLLAAGELARPEVAPGREPTE